MWESNGASGNGSSPALLGKYSGTLLIECPGHTFQHDTAQLTELCGEWRGPRMAVNYMGFLRETVTYTHWASIHTEFFKWSRYIGTPIKNLSSEGPRYLPLFQGEAHGAYPVKGISGVSDVNVWDVGINGGTSTLFAAIVAIAMGYDRVVLTGAPLDGGGYLYGEPNKMGEQYGTRSIFLAWQQASLSVFKGRVRSVSGNSSRWLGRPSKGWLNGDE